MAGGSLSSATPSSNSNRSGRSSQETNDCVFDDAVEVVLNGHDVDPSPDGEIKQFAMQPPGNFEFFRRRRRVPDVGVSGQRSQLDRKRCDDLILDHSEITLRDTNALQSCEHEDSYPVVAVDRVEIGSIEVCQTSLERPVGLTQHLLPLRIPATQIDILVDAIDQSVFRREVPEKILVGDAKPLCQLTQAPIESNFSEELDSAIDDLFLPVFGSEAPTSLGGRAVRLDALRPFLRWD